MKVLLSEMSVHATIGYRKSLTCCDLTRRPLSDESARRPADVRWTRSFPVQLKRTLPWLPSSVVFNESLQSRYSVTNPARLFLVTLSLRFVGF